MPLAAPAKPARSVLDGGEHGATMVVKGHPFDQWSDGVAAE